MSPPCPASTYAAAAVARLAAPDARIELEPVAEVPEQAQAARQKVRSRRKRARRLLEALEQTFELGPHFGSRVRPGDPARTHRRLDRRRSFARGRSKDARAVA